MAKALGWMLRSPEFLMVLEREKEGQQSLLGHCVIHSSQGQTDICSGLRLTGSQAETGPTATSVKRGLFFIIGITGWSN